MTLPMPPETFAQTRERLAELGVTVPPEDAGQVSHRGVVVNYSYASGKLTLELVRKPWIVSEADIKKKLQEWFKA